MALAPVYPAIGVGDLVTADLLTSMIPGVVSKPSLTSRNTTTTLAADPDLSNITLGVGTWKVELIMPFSLTSTTTQKIKTQWGFSGTWNNPVRMCLGPGSAATTSRADVAEVNLTANLANADAVYSVQVNSSGTTVREISATVVVSVAGDLSLQWAQSASSANPTIVQAGAFFEVRQIAA